MDEALVEEIRNATNGNFALGNKRFQSEVATALGRRATRGVAGRPSLQEAEVDDRQSTQL